MKILKKDYYNLSYLLSRSLIMANIDNMVPKLATVKKEVI